MEEQIGGGLIEKKHKKSFNYITIILLLLVNFYLCCNYYNYARISLDYTSNDVYTFPKRFNNTEKSKKYCSSLINTNFDITSNLSGIRMTDILNNGKLSMQISQNEYKLRNVTAKFNLNNSNNDKRKYE